MKNIQSEQLGVLKEWIKEERTRPGVVGLSGSARSYFLSRFLGDLKRPCLIILSKKKEAERLSGELSFFMRDNDGEPDPAQERLCEFPPYDLTPMTGLSPHRELISLRIQSLYGLATDSSPVVITSLEAISLKVLPKKALVDSAEYLEVGEETEREVLIKKLEAGGYNRVSLVEEKGDYSVRGGVIDLSSPLYPLPVRLEFWGDRLESIRQFDPFSQRSQALMSEMVLVPANEIILEKENIQRARSMGRLPIQRENGMRFSGQEAWIQHFYPRLDTILDYVPEEGLIILLDPHRLEAESHRIENKFHRDVERFRTESAEKALPFPETEGLFLPFEELERRLEGFRRLDFTEIPVGVGDPSDKLIEVKGPVREESDLELRLAGKGKVSLAPLAERISLWLSRRGTVVLVTRTEQQAGRLKEILGDYGLEVDAVVGSWEEIREGRGLSICLGRLSEGFSWPEIDLYVVSEDEIFGPKRAKSRPKGKPGASALAWSSLSQLEEGDLVVHDEHGIGRYCGLTKMEIAERINDFVIIEYAGSDRLYIPAPRISILQKYIGVEDSHVKLDKLCGHSWSMAKDKAKKSIKRIAKQLTELYALRKYRKGFAFSQPDHYFREFEASFEHEETVDQGKTIDAVLDDMRSDQPMDRLICGDVGFGKTEVAVRAAFKAVSDGKQVALLVPTTVLAEQHKETFRKRMEPYSISVDILSRFKTRKEQSEVLARLRSGKSDIIIGTHRLLQKDVKFANLGLLIIDEEQRFGVKQKEAIKKYRALIDVLAITATPIPRTFQMSMMGLRDLSIIETPPEDRHAIQTYLSPYDEALIVRAITDELERKGQVFFVHNRVRSIEDVTEKLRRLVPHATFTVAHGQMKERELERTMLRFLRKEADVLVCTTIIESGLDIPSANTIIINEVDRLGLAQVYQLRGRVGRAKEEAYAYLLLSQNAKLSRQAESRLKALMDFTHLGAGLNLALHDLKIRGGGNALGFSQSGHISAIGYELYMKLIERAVAELKGEEWHDEINPEINVDMPAYLPGDYVSDTDIRLNLYRRLSGLLERSELKEMEEEIQDRFGAPPLEARNLLSLISIRIVLKRLGINRLDIGRSEVILTFAEEGKIDPEKIVRFVSEHSKRFRFLSENRLKIYFGRLSIPEDLRRIEENLEKLDFSGGQKKPPEKGG
ncbi:MAG: transcription-repair coupling factor [Desulfatiglans sp.]|nr:transcription-repair coupling factor [Thermodesulfobacteriota bacterium]MEE4353040.1 transcription-repair coupling factor [Desulfatiglans sp.]